MSSTNSRIYLDYAGAGQPSEEQMRSVCADLQSRFLANPHSRHLRSQTTSNIVDRARIQVLEHFNAAKEYDIVFTAGTTHSLKLLAESFLFDDTNAQPIASPNFANTIDEARDGSVFGYLTDSHTSVVGMRQIVQSKYLLCCDSPEDFVFTVPSTHRRLIVLTAMSNFDGKKYDLSVIEQIQNCGESYVCLDAAALVSCSPLDLSTVRPDFVVLSFYKMFGYPTGLGALLVRKDREDLLQKRYYGGGTVDLSHPTKPYVRFRENLADRFEDGTSNYNAIASLRHGFADLERCGGIEAIERHSFKLASLVADFLKTLRHSNGNPVAVIYGFEDGTSNYNAIASLRHGFADFERCGGMKAIEKHSFKLASLVADFLKTLRHSNGNPVAVIYGSGWTNDTPSNSEQGAIVNFNLLRSNGDFVGYVEVEKMCDLFHIDLRTGCFCNQGACMKYLRLNEETLVKNYEDVEVFRTMIESCFVSSPTVLNRVPQEIRSSMALLSQICVFPIKSCGAVHVERSWKITETGLEHDRKWMIVSADGVPLNQKRSRALCFIRPSIEKGTLKVADADNNVEALRVPLNACGSESVKEFIVCKDSVVTVDCGDEAAQWLESLNADEFQGCRLLQQVDSGSRRQCRLSTALLNLSNQAPFLLINRSSATYLADIVGLSTEEVITRFRANFVLDCASAFEEDDIDEIHIGNVEFEVISKCTRCQMICIDQETGIKDPNLLLALRDCRLGDQMTFGLYLRHRDSHRQKTLSVGSMAKLIRKER
uniref:MOSC domain-containing protein n=1 Tax=Steinernema glaseri TaxID=37863 RepID=A0A1I7ZWA5_9BILA